MLISFPAPALCQGGDEDFLVAIGGIVYPGFVRRPENENGLTYDETLEGSRPSQTELWYLEAGEPPVWGSYSFSPPVF
ncbi:MAG: hypothetical protein ACXWX3_07255 [Actinomycetota bacterium]